MFLFKFREPQGALEPGAEALAGPDGVGAAAVPSGVSVSRRISACSTSDASNILAKLYRNFVQL